MLLKCEDLTTTQKDWYDLQSCNSYAEQDTYKNSNGKGRENEWFNRIFHSVILTEDNLKGKTVVIGL